MSWFLIIASFIFFLLRLPSLIEPYWYGDEGIYQVMGMAINNGRLLYRDIWDNKPPLLYLLYSILNSDQFAVRVVLLIFGLLSVFIFFFLTKKLFPPTGRQKIYFFIVSIFALMFALPLLEGNIANAENFMLLPILASALLIFNQVQNRSKLTFSTSQILIAGLLLGIAFLFKVVAVFDFAAFSLFLLFYNLESSSKRHSGPSRISHHLEQKGFWSRLASQNDEQEVLKRLVKIKLFPFFLGFFIPLGITTLFFLFTGAFGDFVRAIFFSNVGYVGYGNKLAVPLDLLFIKLILLLGFVVFLFIKRSRLKPTTLFVLIWFAFSLFNAFFSERPFPHYLLVLLPSASLLLGLIFWDKKYQKIITLFLFLAFVVILKNFHFYGKSISYYQNYIAFMAGQKTVPAYQAFFDKKTPIDYEIALFIKSKMRKKDSIFIWGNNAQVYKLAGSLPPGKYIVAYHIIDYEDGLTNTRDSIEKIKPRFIIIMPDQKPIPFQLMRYSKRIDIDNVSIYERFF